MQRGNYYRTITRHHWEDKQMTKMRIAFITLGFAPLRMSGLDISGERLVRGLLQMGHHVTVIAGTRDSLIETQSHPALEIHRVRLGLSNWVGFAFRAARILEKLNHSRPFDIVHFWDVHFSFAYRGRYVASVQQSFRQRWNSFDASNAGLSSQIYRFTYYSLARRLAEIPAAHRASGLLAGSSATRDEFIEHYAIAPERIALARHGIDMDFFCRSTSTELRTQLGMNADEPVIFFAGFVTPRKGLDYLARALPLIHPRPRLIVAGHWSPSYRSHFFSLLGPGVHQVIEAGFVPDEQMPAYYSLADVYVSPSLLEGFGIPLAESLACETPVVAVNAGSAAEVAGPGGILVPPRDPVSLADAVSKLLQDPFLRNALGKQGREHIKREFNIQKMVNDTSQAYWCFSPTESTRAL